jgi:hypothetical protein
MLFRHYIRNIFTIPSILFHTKYHNINNYFCLFICFLFTIGSLSALSGEFAGLGVEGNANTREGAAFGGSLSGGVDLDDQFSLGLRITLSSNIDTVTTMEPAAFFRYYLPFNFSGLFAQAELGMSLFFEDGESYPAFLGGLAFGWRYNVNKNWYIEPSVRAGYPFLWGVGILAGLSFDIAALRQ